jgi:hypothetical protein
MSKSFLLISVILVLFFLFLICRELFCWYWKINTRIKLQEETNSMLRQLLEKNSYACFTNSTENFKEEKGKEEPFYGDPDELKKAIEELKG